MKTRKLTRAVVASLIAVALLACGATTSQLEADSTQQANFAAYAAQEQACVTGADGSLAAADACQKAVVARYCGDGGALAGHCAGQTDAGGQ